MACGYKRVDYFLDFFKEVHDGGEDGGGRFSSDDEKKVAGYERSFKTTSRAHN